MLTVFLSDSDSKPIKPIFNIRNIDLSRHFKEEKAYVGFSTSSQEGMELYMIKNWSFRSSSNLGHKKDKRLRIVVLYDIVLVVALFSMLGYLSLQKWMSGKTLGITSTLRIRLRVSGLSL